MSEVTKWVSVVGGVLTILSLLVAVTWRLGHSDASIISLQQTVAHMSENMEILTQTVVSLKDELNSMNERERITQEYQQKEIEDIKTSHR